MAIKNNISRHRKKPQRAGFRWLFIIGVLFCLLLAHAWVRTEATQTMIRISQAEKKMMDALSYQRALALEIDRLKSEERINRIAQARLNLVRDTGKKTYYLTQDGDNG